MSLLGLATELGDELGWWVVEGDLGGSGLDDPTVVGLGLLGLNSADLGEVGEDDVDVGLVLDGGLLASLLQSSGATLEVLLDGASLGGSCLCCRCYLVCQ